MREKRPALVITFPTTAAAMGCESMCIERDEELLRGELAAAGVPTEGYTVIDMWEVVR